MQPMSMHQFDVRCVLVRDEVFFFFNNYLYFHRTHMCTDEQMVLLAGVEFVNNECGSNCFLGVNHSLERIKLIQKMHI